MTKGDDSSIYIVYYHNIFLESDKIVKLYSNNEKVNELYFQLKFSKKCLQI